MSGTTTVLSRRELEILRLVAEGWTNGEVAKILWVTDQTISFHLMNIYKKLNVRNRVEAACWLREHGLDDPEGDAGVREPRRPIRPSLNGGAVVDSTQGDDSIC